MEAAVKSWCDKNIGINMSYRGSIPLGKPISCGLENPNERLGKLIYQDGTACSASHAFADVYQLDTGDYKVYMDASGFSFCDIVETLTFEKLSYVVNYLAGFSGHDPNACGELMIYLMERIKDDHIIVKETQPWFGDQRVPKLSGCEDNNALIQAVLDYGSQPYNKISDIPQPEIEDIPIKSEHLDRLKTLLGFKSISLCRWDYLVIDCGYVERLVGKMDDIIAKTTVDGEKGLEHPLMFFVVPEAHGHRCINVQPDTDNVQAALMSHIGNEDFYIRGAVCFKQGDWDCNLLELLREYNHCAFFGTQPEQIASFVTGTDKTVLYKRFDTESG